MVENYVVDTQRLALRPVTKQDAHHIYRVMNSPKFLKYVGVRDVRDDNTARQYIEKRMLPQYEERGYGNHVIVRKSDGVELGTIGIFHRTAHDPPDIGYALIEAYEGRGYATEAAMGMLRQAFEGYGLDCVYAFAIPSHVSSIRILDRVGMSQAGGVRWGDPGEWLSWYRITKNQYLSLSPTITLIP